MTESKPEGIGCEACQGTGWILVSSEGQGAVKPCECKKRAITFARISTILKDWPKYQGASFENTKPKSIGQQNAKQIISEKPDGSYYFTGLYQRGKTHFLICQYRYLALAGRKCLLRSARDLMEELRRSEVPVSRDVDVIPSAVLQMVNLSESGHLFIDDIEKISNTGFRIEMLWDILDTINRRQLKLSVSSNLPLICKDKSTPDLRSKLGSEIVSRIYQVCEVLEL